MPLLHVEPEPRAGASAPSRSKNPDPETEPGAGAGAVHHTVSVKYGVQNCSIIELLRVLNMNYFNIFLARLF